MRLWLACSIVNKDTACLERSQALFSGGFGVHSELVIEMTCSKLADGGCPYCECTHEHSLIFEKGGSDNARLKSGEKKSKVARTHVVTYSVHSNPPYDKVFCKIGKKYNSKKARNQYFFIPIEVFDNRLIEKVRLFLHNQLGKPFNKWGLRLNFLPGLRSCVSIGSKRTAQESRSWFCSELCTAALQQIDFLMDRVPCKTSTNDLVYIFFVQNKYRVEHSLRN